MIERYYLLGNSAGNDVGNVAPQSYGLPPDYDETSESSMTRLSNRAFPAVIPDLRFMLKPEAVLTDVVNVGNISSCGLLVNQGVRELLGQFNVIQHRYYEASVMARGAVYEYYWLHMVPCDHRGIDFARSTFATYAASLFKLGKLADIQCRNEEELLYHLDHTRGFGAERIILTREFMAEQYDMFIFPRIGMTPPLIVSDRLRECLLNEAISGIVIQEQHEVEF